MKQQTIQTSALGETRNTPKKKERVENTQPARLLSEKIHHKNIPNEKTDN
jgi:hypothetical protein